MPAMLPWRAAAALACGHLAAMAVVAGAWAWRLPLDRPALQWGAGLMLLAALACHVRRRRAASGQAGMVLLTFCTSTAHGAGFMLVPALVSICATGAGGALLQTLAALGLHLAAMVAANGAILWLGCHVGKRCARWRARLTVPAR
ncbi:MAG: hypothetical protein K0R43_2972 [Pseudoduganella sp.]|jgi:hypothetical protein|nr:hypothetical protein [Pseudoduganella sp.]